MKISAVPRIELQVLFNVSEDEARALHALAGYGDDEVVRVFYTYLGRSYMEPHENGLRTLLATIREQMPAILDRVDGARRAFAEKADV